MQRRARRERVGEQFLQRIDRAGHDGAVTAHVRVDGHAPLRGELEQVQDLLAARARRVRDADSDAEAAFGEPLAHELDRLPRSSAVATSFGSLSRGSGTPESRITAMRAGICPDAAP